MFVDKTYCYDTVHNVCDNQWVHYVYFAGAGNCRVHFKEGWVSYLFSDDNVLKNLLIKYKDVLLYDFQLYF